MTTYKQTIQEITLLNQITPNTHKIYDLVHTQYTTLHQMTWEQLIQEAEQDEQTIPKPSKRRIKKRIQEYIYHLLEEDKQPTTIKQYTTILKKLYTTNEIELPQIKLPRINPNREGYEDLPTRQEITQAIHNSKLKMKATILLIVSSGMARNEVCNLTIQDFKEATREYYHQEPTTVYELINILKKQQHIIPVWHIKRRKTNVNYITCNSPEATKHILQLLELRLIHNVLTFEDTLLGYNTPSLVTHNFMRLNDRLGFGRLATRRRFHPHALRSYFATTINSRGMPYLCAEFMLGHTVDSTRSAYYKAEPSQIKREYMRVVNYLSFVTRVETVTLDDDERRELEELKEYKQYTEQRMLKLEEAVRTLTL